MTNAIEVRKETALTPFSPQGLEQAMTLAKTLAGSGLMPASLRGKPQDVLVVLITGHELGLSPMQAVRSVHVVQGRAVMSADLMVALAVRAPACEYLRLVSSDDKAAVYETKRKGSPEPVRMSFTMEQAKAAGLTGKDNWRAYPAAMLRARCSAALVRAVYPDLALGVYEPDEAEAFGPRQRGAPPRTATPAPTPEPETGTVDAAAVEILARPDDTAEPSDAAEPADAAGELEIAILTAPDRAALTALVPELKRLPPEDRAALRPIYSRRARELA